MARQSSLAGKGTRSILFFFVGMAILIFGVYTSGSTLVLAVFGKDTPGTVYQYDVKRDDEQSGFKTSYRVHQRYSFTVDGTVYEVGTEYSTKHPLEQLEQGKTRTEMIRYLPASPKMNKPASVASFSELGFIRGGRLFLVPILLLALLGFGISGALGFQTPLSKFLARKKPADTDSPG